MFWLQVKSRINGQRLPPGGDNEKFNSILLPTFQIEFVQEQNRFISFLVTKRSLGKIHCLLIYIIKVCYFYELFIAKNELYFLFTKVQIGFSVIYLIDIKS